MLYTVVIPCYKSAGTIRKVVEETMEQFEKMKAGELEFVLVDDCSPDGGATVRTLRGLVQDYDNVRVVELAKNAQTSPTQLPKLLAEINKGYDIVYGYYPHKQHSKFRNWGSRFNQWTTRVLLDKPKNMKTSSFWIIRRFVRDYAVQYRSAYTHLQGVFLRVTRNISCIPVEHFRRREGQSGYTFRKLVQLWSNISIVPLRMATVLGNIFAAVGLVGIIAVIVRKLVRPVTAIGWPSIMVSIFFFSGLILMFMGLIGEYIGRIFLGLCNNPQYVVRQIDEQGKRPYLVNEDGQQFELKNGTDWRKERETE